MKITIAIIALLALLNVASAFRMTTEAKQEWFYGRDCLAAMECYQKADQIYFKCSVLDGKSDTFCTGKRDDYITGDECTLYNDSYWTFDKYEQWKAYLVTSGSP